MFGEHKKGFFFFLGGGGGLLVRVGLQGAVCGCPTFRLLVDSHGVIQAAIRVEFPNLACSLWLTFCLNSRFVCKCVCVFMSL